MSDGSDLLREIDYQARELGNLILALQRTAQAWGGADLELRFHLRRMARWIVSRLEPHHDPSSLAGRVGWPADLGPLPGDPGGAPAAGIEAPLLDAQRSGVAFLARLVVDDGPAAGPRPAAALEEALDRARCEVFRRLSRVGLRLDATRLGGRIRLEGAEAARLHRVDGGSIGAAAAAALFARWTDSTPPSGLVITGGLATGGAITDVAGIEEKTAAALRERPLARVLVPARQAASVADPRVQGIESLDGLLRELFGPDARAGAAGPLDVEGTVRVGVELYEKRGSFALAHEVLGLALEAIEQERGRRGEPTLHRTEEVLALWRGGSSLIHLGDLEGALARFDRALPLAERLWERGEIDPRTFLGLRGNLAVLHRDRFEHAAAEALLLENLSQQRALRQDRRELAKTLGNLGELYTFMERFEEAEARLEEALDALRAVYPDEVPRELCYLGNLHLRRADPLRALACYEEGLERNRQVTHGRLANEVFLRYGLTRAHQRLNEAARAERQASRALALLESGELYPRQLILKERGLARLARGRWDEGVRDLEAAADRTHARGELAALAAATALGELALAQIARGQADGGLDRARRFRAEGRRGLSRMCPPPELEALDRALDGADAGALTTLLRAILDRFPY